MNEDSSNLAKIRPDITLVIALGVNSAEDNQQITLGPFERSMVAGPDATCHFAFPNQKRNRTAQLPQNIVRLPMESDA